MAIKKNQPLDPLIDQPFELNRIVLDYQDRFQNFKRPKIADSFSELVEGIPLGLNYCTFPKDSSWFGNYLIGCGYSFETLNYKWDGRRRGKEPLALLQYTISGSGKLNWHHKEFDLTEGSMMILKSPDSHRYWLPPQSSHWSFIFITLFGNEVTRFAQKAIDTHGGPVFHLDPSDSLVSLMSDICRKTSQGVIHSTYQTMEVAARCMAILGKKVFIPNEKNDCHPAIEKSKQFCRLHFKKNISIAEVSKSCRLSPSYFISLFHKEMGVSPRSYIESLRLEEACKLILKGGVSMKNIAYDCGFASPNYFSKVFRKTYQVSPRNFSKKVF